MAFCYRFLDSNNNIIYVGYTGQKLEERMHQHFTKGHLDPICYKNVAKIEYIKFATKSDAQIMEVYFINKYKPIHNKQNKRNDAVTINLEEKEWKLYKQIKKHNEPIALKWGWLQIGFLIYAIYVIIQYLLGII